MVPATVLCKTISSSGDVYDVECNLKFSGTILPESVNFMEATHEKVAILGVSADGEGKSRWNFKLRFDEHVSVGLLFDLHFPASPSVKVGATYNPFVSAFSPKLPKIGRLLERPDGTKIREYRTD